MNKLTSPWEYGTVNYQISIKCHLIGRVILDFIYLLISFTHVTSVYSLAAFKIKLFLMQCVLNFDLHETCVFNYSESSNKIPFWAKFLRWNSEKYNHTLTLWTATPQNGQTHLNNSSTFADEFFECVWPFCGAGA